MLDLWYKNAIVYSLDIETFSDADADGIGDLKGLTHRLDYLSGLGVTCVWLLPFYQSPNRDNGYDVTDYFRVDPRLGDLGDFVVFARQAQEYGIRILIDLVVNHTSDQHPWFREARTDPNSKFREFYVWSKRKPDDIHKGVVFPGHQHSVWTYDESADAWYFHRFYEHQPDLNVANPAVREEIEKIMGFWLELGVSGFRIDAAPFLIEPAGERTDPERDAYYGYLQELRRFLSWRRGDAILLAEANVTPDRATRYFGDEGDRMHMIFNFYINQHLFLALARRDATPLRQAWAELPPLPLLGQWTNFLRNHDELDLGRLPDTAREDVFTAFAPDVAMRLYDRGIRRRLAPMLGNDRRLIELSNSLIFSLPGTPVIRYGEEIGMGEDLSLPERQAVRTPMQWTPDHNAGFSDAPAESLIRPIIEDEEFGYESVNIAGQQRDPGSLLNWMERLIRTRKSCPEIGWGECTVLETNQTAVFAHRCRWHGQSIVALHNFSEHEHSIDVPRLPDDGAMEELFGDRDYGEPRNGTIALAPYGYRWFRIGRKT